MPRHEAWELKSMQAAPLSAKIAMTRDRINEWIDEFGEDGVYLSFSGGKDSTVLLDIIREEFEDIPVVFVNTGLEYPSVQKFAKSKDNVVELRPSLTFTEIVRKYGYPVISKEVAGKVKQFRDKPDGSASKCFQGNGGMFDYTSYLWLTKAPFRISAECCDISKKSPAISYANKTGRKPIVATMAEESRLRKQKWLMHGCNAFDTEHPQSNPMAFWTENDVLAYIHRKNLPIAEAYGEVVGDEGDEIHGQQSIHDALGDYTDCKFRTTGCNRTGCVFCLFGIRTDKTRLTHLKEVEPKICDHVMRGGQIVDGMWEPGNGGLGYWFVLEWLNLHGNLGIEIPDRDRYMREYMTPEIEEMLKGTPK